MIKQERPAASYASIIVSSGIDVYLIQGDVEKIEVEADENLQSLIITEVKNGVLNIYSERPIRKAHKKNVYVSFKQLSDLKADVPMCRCADVPMCRCAPVSQSPSLPVPFFDVTMCIISGV